MGGAIVLIILTAGCSSHTTHTASPTPTTSANTGTVTTTPHSATGLTAEQLNAHLGVGVPAGWVPVDYGDARVFVPSGWYLEAHGSCIWGGSVVAIIATGRLPYATCRPRSQRPIPPEAIALVPSSQRHVGAAPSLTDHTYRIYKVASAKATWSYYDVPQLGVRIATHGTLGTRILNTLAPSARTIALVFAHEAVPNHWHAVSENGVSLSMPPSWGVASATYWGCGWPNGEPELLLVKPGIGVASCGGPQFPTAQRAVEDGAHLYLPPHNPFTPIPTGHSIVILNHGATIITIYAETNDPNALDLFVRKSGSKITHVLTLGLGRDGRIAGGVLASIREVA